ncbi:unnamed protein product [Peniophora sp. CBMAI 1063]|nr:unnamed protein product [Peniophora sp. CBMAI 1063]
MRFSVHLYQNLQIEIARAKMELAQKRLALLLAQVELGNVKDDVRCSEPGEATAHEGGDAADVTDVPQCRQGPDVAEDANATPPVATIDDESTYALDIEPTKVPGDGPGGADTDENDDDTYSPAALDENNEVESLVRDDDEDPEMSPITIKAESEKAEMSAAPTTEDEEDAMPIGPFIDRVLRWAGAVWSDAETRPGVDFEAAADLATEMIGFEVVSVRDNQVALRAPLDIKSAKQWASKQRMPSKIYSTVAEPNYTQLVAQTWRRIRQQPYVDVMKMTGRYGLIGVVRAIYQANAVDPKKCEDFRALMLDAADALRAMRATIGAVRDAQPGPASGLTTTASSSLLEVLTQRDPKQTAQATEVIDRMCNGDVIEIESEDEEPARSSKKGGSRGKVVNVPTKRKPASTPGPSPKPKRRRF